MKKFFLAGIFFALWFALPAHALLTLTVNSGAPVDIGRVRIGQDNFKAAPIELNCVQDQANTWELSVSAVNDLIDQRSGYSIPMENLKWYGAYKDSATGSFLNGTGGISVPLSETPEAVYGDALTTGARVQVGLGVVVPDAQPQGNYRTTVQFIMTE